MRSLGYEDINLVPRVISSIKSRYDIEIAVELFPGVVLTNPIIASPMKDVVNAEVAREMRRLGGYAILHRFQSIDDQVKEFNEANRDCACAIGLDEIDRFDS